MKKLIVKVCGLTEPANIEAIRALGVDMLGFIFYPLSPRYVLGKMPPNSMAGIAAGPQKVGVFVNETVGQILTTANACGLDALQLHGQETPEHCNGLRPNFKVIKAFSIAGVDDFEQTNAYEDACDYFLFDTKGPSHGGNGFAFNWDILDAYTGRTPFLLSGGIAPGDAEKINALQHPKLAGIDLNSRFESSPGVKDVALLAEFKPTTSIKYNKLTQPRNMDHPKFQGKSVPSGRHLCSHGRFRCVSVP